MRYDKQTDSLLIPLAQVASVTRAGKAIDHTNAWILNLPGAIVITTKTEEKDEHSGPGNNGGIEDGDGGGSTVGRGRRGT